MLSKMMLIRMIIPLIALLHLSAPAIADDTSNLRGVGEDEFSMQGRRQLSFWMDFLTQVGHFCKCDGKPGPLSCHVPNNKDCAAKCSQGHSGGPFCQACTQCSSDNRSSTTSGDAAKDTDSSFTTAASDGYWDPDKDQDATHSSAADGAYTYADDQAGTNKKSASYGTSSVAIWGYIAAAVAVAAFIIAAVMRKRNQKEEEHGLDGAVAKRMTLLEDDGSVSTATSKGTEPPTFIDMEPDAVQIGISGATEPSASPSNYSSF